MLFPIKDDDRGISGPCYVTLFLLLANIAVFIYQALNPEFTYGWSTVPQEITTGQDLVGVHEINDGQGGVVELEHQPGPGVIYFTLISSMFMHGGLMHIISNMLFLWIFGDNVEHRFGSRMFLVFYLVSGVIASFAHIMTDTASVLPSLGASGAVAGILGAYLVLFPRNRVNAVLIVFIISLPAFVVIGLWAVSQFFGGIGAIFQSAQTGGVAYMAHIGGFVAGVVLGLLHKKLVPEERDSLLLRNYREDENARRLFGSGS